MYPSLPTLPPHPHSHAPHKYHFILDLSYGWWGGIPGEGGIPQHGPARAPPPTTTCCLIIKHIDDNRVSHGIVECGGVGPRLGRTLLFLESCLLGIRKKDGNASCVQEPSGSVKCLGSRVTTDRQCVCAHVYLRADMTGYVCLCEDMTGFGF